MSGSTRLAARGLGVDYGAGAHATTVLTRVDVALEAGRVVVVAGPNGAGKSTLVRALAGLVRPTRGDVVMARHGEMIPLATVSARARATTVGALLEVPDGAFGFTVRELVLLGRYPHFGRMGFASARDRAGAEAAIATMRLEALAARRYPTLSSGERQRVAIARLLCQDTPVMLLDEPSSHLDPAHALHVVAELRAAAARGKAVLAVVHDLDLAAKLADALVVVAAGEVVAHGPPAVVLTPELVARVWGVRARRVDDGRPALVLDGIAGDRGPSSLI